MQKKFKVEYGKAVSTDFERIGKQNTLRVRKKIRWFSEQENPLRFSEPLVGLKNRYRWRIGDWRVIFKKNEQTKQLIILMILAIRKRDKAYD